MSLHLCEVRGSAVFKAADPVFEAAVEEVDVPFSEFFGAGGARSRWHTRGLVCLRPVVVIQRGGGAGG